MDLNQQLELIEKQTNKLETEYDNFLLELEKIEANIYMYIISLANNKLSNSLYYASVKQIDKYLNDGEYKKKYEEYIYTINKIIQNNKDIYNIYKIRKFLSNLDINALKILQNSMFNNYNLIGKKALQEIENFIVGEVTVKTKDFSQFKKDLKDLITGTDKSGGCLKKYADTYANTSVMQFQRFQNMILSKNNGIDTYLYGGAPLIKTSRSFCKKYYKKWCRREEINKLHNPLVNNIFLECGGWNCRHQWIPISEEKLKNSGYEHAN